MAFLAWYDPTPDKKKPTAQKIEDACARYIQKFGTQPIVCLVNPEDACHVEGIEIRPLAHIGRNCFWVGRDDEEGRG